MFGWDHDNCFLFEDPAELTEFRHFNPNVTETSQLAGLSTHIGCFRLTAVRTRTRSWTGHLGCRDMGGGLEEGQGGAGWGWVVSGIMLFTFVVTKVFMVHAIKYLL